MLLRFFLLGVPVARARVADLLSTQLRERLTGAGLLVEDAAVVHGAARLVPHDELLIASDHAARRNGTPTTCRACIDPQSHLRT